MSRLNLILLIILIILGGVFVYTQNKSEILNTKNSPQLIPTPSTNIKSMPKQKTIRQPAVAGQFYPEDPTELSQMIDKFLGAAELPKAAIVPTITIVPHAGYIFSGHTASHGVTTIEGKKYDNVIIIGSSHN